MLTRDQQFFQTELTDQKEDLEKKIVDIQRNVKDKLKQFEDK